jgi:hypothetical protein
VLTNGEIPIVFKIRPSGVAPRKRLQLQEPGRGFRDGGGFHFRAVKVKVGNVSYRDLAAKFPESQPLLGSEGVKMKGGQNRGTVKAKGTFYLHGAPALGNK